MKQKKQFSIWLAAPKNISGISHLGEEYEVEDGRIEVPPELKAHLLAQGFTEIQETVAKK